VEELLEAGVVPEGRECGVGVDCGEITIAEVEGFLQSGKSFLLVAVPCVEGTQPVKIIRGLHCPSLQHGGHGLAVAVLCSERLCPAEVRHVGISAYLITTIKSGHGLRKATLHIEGAAEMVLRVAEGRVESNGLTGWD